MVFLIRGIGEGVRATWEDGIDGRIKNLSSGVRCGGCGTAKLLDSEVTLVKGTLISLDTFSLLLGDNDLVFSAFHGRNGSVLCSFLACRHMRFFSGAVNASCTLRGSAHFLLFLKQIGETLTSTLSSLLSVGEWISTSKYSSSSPPEHNSKSRPFAVIANSCRCFGLPVPFVILFHVVVVNFYGNVIGTAISCTN